MELEKARVSGDGLGNLNQSPDTSRVEQTTSLEKAYSVVQIKQLRDMGYICIQDLMATS